VESDFFREITQDLSRDMSSLKKLLLTYIRINNMIVLAIIGYLDDIFLKLTSIRWFRKISFVHFLAIIFFILMVFFPRFTFFLYAGMLYRAEVLIEKIAKTPEQYTYLLNTSRFLRQSPLPTVISRFFTRTEGVVEIIVSDNAKRNYKIPGKTAIILAVVGGCFTAGIGYLKHQATLNADIKIKIAQIDADTRKFELKEQRKITVSQNALTVSQNALTVSENAYNTAKANLETAKANLEALKIQSELETKYAESKKALENKKNSWF
jgi:hypothetical protein